MSLIFLFNVMNSKDVILKDCLDRVSCVKGRHFDSGGRMGNQMVGERGWLRGEDMG